MKTRTSVLSLIIAISCIINTTLIFAETDTTATSLFELSIEELLEQKVEIATKSSQKISETPSVVSVITAEEIRAMGFRNLFEVIQIIPGFETSQIFHGPKAIGIRGVSNVRQGARILVLLDGFPYNDIMYGSAVIFGHEFNLDAVDKIEIIRGPGSALYGRNAFSTVINIITKSATKKVSTEMGISLGSFNTYSAYGNFGVNKNKVSAFISAKYYSSDGTNSKFDDGMGGKSVYNMTNDNIYINANIKVKNISFKGSFTQRIHGTSASQYFMTYGNNTFNIGTYSLSYKKDLSSRFAVKVKVYGRNGNRIQNIEEATPNTTYIHPLIGVPINSVYPEGFYAKPVFEDYVYGTELELNYMPIKNNSLLVGVQADVHGIKNASVRSNYDLETKLPLTYYDNDSILRQYSKSNMPLYEAGWIQDNGHDYHNMAIYLQDMHYFNKLIGVTGGIRFDYDSETGFILNPRFGAVIEPSKRIFIKALYGEAYRAPTTSEQYKQVGFDKGNENLEYEEIKTSEIVLGYKGDRIFAQASVYYNFLDNLVLQQFDSVSSNVNSYYNNGQNTSYGLDVEAKYFISKSVYSFFTFSYVQSEDIKEIHSTGEKRTSEHPNIANHLFNIGLNSHIGRYLNYSVYFRYNGLISKFENEDISSSEKYISQDVVGDYYLLNSTVRLINLVDGLELSLSGYNLLNQKYYFQDNLNSNQPAQPQINFIMRVKYKFNL